jgi:hypothetical protein
MTFGGFYLLQLVMELISFCKCVAQRYASKAGTNPEILGELRYGIGRQLVQLRYGIGRQLVQLRLEF